MQDAVIVVSLRKGAAPALAGTAPAALAATGSADAGLVSVLVAAAALALVHRDDDDRAAEPLHEPRRHDADDAGVPILAADDEHAVPGSGGVGLQRLQSSGKDLLFGLLALGVDLGQAFSYAGGLILVAAEQQLERYRSDYSR
jgi:hypothetical protein